MKKLVNVLFLSLLMSVILFSCTTRVPKANLKTDVDSISYAVGVLHASRIDQIFMQLDLNDKHKAEFIRGFMEGFAVDSKDKKEFANALGKSFGLELGAQWVPQFNAQLFGDTVQTISRKNFLAGYIGAIISDSTTIMSRQDAEMYYMTANEAIRMASAEKRRVEMKKEAEKLHADTKKENEKWLEDNKSNEGVIALPSGLQYKVITEGKGPKPVLGDRIKVYYKGTNIKGEVFDSTAAGEAREFFLSENGLIKGWIEGFQLIPVGSKYMLYIPAELAYDEQERHEFIKPFSTLIFEVELLDIVK